MIAFHHPRPIAAYFPPATRAGSPVSLQLAKMHINAGGCYDAASADAYTAEDMTISVYLASATTLVEDILGRGLLTQQWSACFSGLDGDGKLTIETGPIQSVAPTLEALISGVYVAVATTVYVWRRIGVNRMNIRLAAGQSWPIVDSDDAAWRVTFTTGYGAAAAVPPPIGQAILILTKGLYESREDLNPGNAGENPALMRLLRPYMAPSI